MIFFYSIVKNLKEQYILHPYLLIIYFLLHHLISFNEEFRWYEPIVIVTVALLFSEFLKNITQKFIPNNLNSSYFLSFILTCFFFYEDIRQTASHIFTFQIRNRYSLTFILFASILLFFYLRHSRRSNKINLFLNSLLIVYLLIDFISVLISKFNTNDFVQTKNIINKVNTDRFPDIYLLLVDGYGSNQNLNKYYHFNNNSFTDSLRKNHFRVIENSKSNYFYTAHTMSSALNLRYHLPTQRSVQSEMMELIKENLFTQTLVEQGYQINNLSIFQIKGFDTKYGLKIWMNRSSLLFYYFSKTPIFTVFTMREKGEGLTRELGVFNALDSLARISPQKPKFVYAHILLPHVPFYLNELGMYEKKVNDRNPSLSGIKDLVDNDPNNNTMGSSEADSLLKTDYINHTKYTNKKCFETISTILKYNKRPPIIILMSDHGSRMLTNPVPNSEAVKERYENFCTIYYPDKDYSKLYDSITPINVMRQVLNKSVGTKYANLKDISGLVME